MILWINNFDVHVHVYVIQFTERRQSDERLLGSTSRKTKRTGLQGTYYIRPEVTDILQRT